MLVYEISKTAVKEYGSAEKAISAGMFTKWNNERVQMAFNFGNGTEKDFSRYMRDNVQFCYFIKMEE